eukprot:1842075-Pyramimonas_sp.AAC.1
MSTVYPDSFMAKYSAHNCEHHQKISNTMNNVPFLLEMFQNLSGFQAPEADSLVIHLRLGDMVEGSQADVLTMLLRGATPAAHKNFANTIRSAHELLKNTKEANVTKVHLVGGGCMQSLRDQEIGCQKSYVYAKCLQDAFLHEGYKTTLSIDSRTADRDFYFMSHAKKLVLSAGGYSRLLGRLVEALGGTVYGRRN